MRALAQSSTRTYLALGDSYAFGYRTGTIDDAGFGDQGYVAPYADWLASRPGFGGVRPNVINLSVPGETPASFFTTTQFGRFYNLNYQPEASGSQSAFFAQRVQSEQGAGRTISTVTISMGGNDLLALRSDPTFISAPLAQQRQRVDQAIATAGAGYTQILTQVRTLLPATDLILVGYFNPFAAVPNSPFAPVSGYAIEQINTRIAGLATQFNGRYVDIQPRFLGHEAEWSNITQDPIGDNVHPNDAGYAQIAQAIIVPTPAGAGMIGAVGLCVLARRRRRSERAA